MTTDGHDAIQEAKKRRVELREAMIDYEAAITTPVASPTWLENAVEGLEVLRTALGKHISEVDRADGIIAKALDHAPWLESHAEILREQHGDLSARVRRLGEILDGLDTSDATGIAIMREESYDLIRHLSRHRQNGAELVYDAYDMDIGGRG